MSSLALLGRLAERANIHCWRICLREIQSDADNLELPEDVTLTELHPDNFTALANHGQISSEFLEKASRQQDTCVIARRNGQLLGFSWRSRYSVQVIPGMSLHLTPDNAFIGFKTWVEAEARGLRLFEKMRRFLDLKFLSAGVPFGISYIGLSNQASWASMARDPYYRVVGWLVIADWGRLTWTHVSPGAARWVSVAKD